jgi:hypothetical protein
LTRSSGLVPLGWPAGGWAAAKEIGETTAAIRPNKKTYAHTEQRDMDGLQRIGESTMGDDGD